MASPTKKMQAVDQLASSPLCTQIEGVEGVSPARKQSAALSRQ